MEKFEDRPNQRIHTMFEYALIVGAGPLITKETLPPHDDEFRNVRNVAFFADVINIRTHPYGCGHYIGQVDVGGVVIGSVAMAKPGTCVKDPTHWWMNDPVIEQESDD